MPASATNPIAILLAAAPLCLIGGRAHADVDALPLHVAEPVSEADYRNIGSEHGPRPYAIATPVAVGLDGGSWASGGGDTLIWRTRVTSPGARSLSLMLPRFAGAPDARLYLRAAGSDMTQGPYGIDDVDREGRLWTALVFDDTAIVEVLVPAAQRDALVLEIAGAYHGWSDLRGTKNIGGTSGSCNVDVACPQGDDWRDQIRSVVGLSYTSGNFRSFCTGNLVNNTSSDGTPLVLTAHHCGIREGNAGSIIAYWNYQAATCGGDAPSFTQSQNGAGFLATHERSDHTLVQLADQPDAAFNVHFAGWDAREDIAVNSGVSIHHPDADTKKISVFTTPLVKERETITRNNGLPQTVDAWRVRWSQGTTEGGSSGSGIWDDTTGRLIGVLFGGRASCGQNQDLEDYYGRLDVGWEGGGTIDTQMRACMDKAQLGVRTLDGADAGALGPAADAGASRCPDPFAGSDGNDGGGGGSSGGSFWAPLLLIMALLGRGSTAARGIRR